ncbi:MAG TPA: hypothetical protein VFA65_15860 [Bryobacteraceae bacterium]|nr:hypothetical protein [Bryobacteraceae bacterium]
MRRLIYVFRSFLLTGVLLCPVIITGCSVHARYYDAPHRDYHTWGPPEYQPYSHWESDTHRNHVDYNHLSKSDKQAYWNWRHDHQ